MRGLNLKNNTRNEISTKEKARGIVSQHRDNGINQAWSLYHIECSLISQLQFRYSKYKVKMNVADGSESILHFSFIRSECIQYI